MDYARAIAQRIPGEHVVRPSVMPDGSHGPAVRFDRVHVPLPRAQEPDPLSPHGQPRLAIEATTSDEGTQVSVGWFSTQETLYPYTEADGGVLVVSVDGGFLGVSHYPPTPVEVLRDVYLDNALEAASEVPLDAQARAQLDACLAAARAHPEHTPGCVNFPDAAAQVESLALATLDEHVAALLTAAAKTYGFPSFAEYQERQESQQQ